MATTPHEGSAIARHDGAHTTAGTASGFWARPVGLRAGGSAPRWVVVLAGVMTGFAMIAVQSHGPGRLVAWLVVLACLAPLLVHRLSDRRSARSDHTR